MLVAAAPVKVIANPPFVVSADNASVHAGAFEIAVTVDATKVVLAALASRLINPSTFQAADSVPPAACLRDTIKPVKA
jgi:ferric-dicitrate binding protein FerR (iron transport regulator)